MFIPNGYNTQDIGNGSIMMNGQTSMILDGMDDSKQWYILIT